MPGDLFHSDYNKEWKDFSEWLILHDEVKFLLVKGNHDILPQEVYLRTTSQVTEIMSIGPFVFTHKAELNDDLYNISGHVHPCVRMRGTGKQGLRLPCFYFGEKGGLLPAFGNFTGSHPIRPKQSDQIYGIIEDSVIDLMTKKRANFP